MSKKKKKGFNMKAIAAAMDSITEEELAEYGLRSEPVGYSIRHIEVSGIPLMARKRVEHE